jgi:hypothetical protein
MAIPGGGPAGARLHALATATTATNAALLLISIPLNLIQDCKDVESAGKDS